ncbi:MAG: hypothetical protein GF400_01130 [Candidatus Eisenbacteria bacterium]|nr:hypothetical protein [Candidatus Eisenbacteria bacterium]
MRSRRRPASRILLAALIACCAAPAAKSETDASASGVVNADYQYNTGVEASAADVRLDLDVTVGPVVLGAAYRAYQLSDGSYNPAGVDVPLADLKHRYAAYYGDRFEARVGHFLSTFGHGLTLRSYEDVELEYDTMLDGFLGRYDAGAVSLTGLAGTVDEDLLGVRHREHRVRGARVSVPVGGWLEVAGSAVERASTVRDEEIEIPDAQALFEDGVTGAEVSLWLGPVTLAGEYASRSGENPVTESAMTGYAAYASGTVALGPLTLFGEFKDYESFSHHLVNPPTCVRDHVYMLMNRATYEIDLDDERGFLVEGTVPLGDPLLLSGGASEARDHEGDLAHWEIFGTAEHYAWDAVSGAVAWSWSREYELGVFTEHLTGAADFYLTTGEGNLVELTVEAQRTEEPGGFSHSDYLGAWTFYPGSDVTLSCVLEATDDDSEKRDVWFMTEVRTLLMDDLEVSFSMGTERGGKKCSGGVCYFEPEFEGARVRLSKYF